MAAVQAKALFDFESGGPGELAFHTDELLTIVRQDVGEGWWEAKNDRGQRGLVPESYLEITSFKEPSIPPPPPPTQTWQPTSAAWQMPVHHQQQQQQPVAWNSGAVNDHTVQQHESDDWDDDWDDDDDDNSSTADAQDVASIDTAHGEGGKAVRRREAANKGTVRNPLSRLSQFAKSGIENNLFDALHATISESDKKFVIIEGADGPLWRPIDSPFTCQIASPKKETKFHGMKSFIAYQITPSFSSIQVSRRYKHFDWLHARLVEKYCTVAIPPLPEKQISGRFEDEFVNQRLRQLQAWVDRMCNHPVVAHSDVFQHFLTCTDDKLWKSGKRKAEKDDYLGGRMFITIRTPSHPVDVKAAEQRLEKFGRFVKSMDDSIKQLSCVCDSNAKKHQGPFKKEFQKLGDSFMALAKSFEFDARPGADSLTKAIEHTGRTYEGIGTLYSEQPKNDMMFLLDGLQEYRGLLSIFPDTLMLQKTAVAKVQEMSTKVQDNASGKMTESDLQSMHGRADAVTYAVLAEVQHFEQHRISDFRDYVTQYLQGQIEFYKAITERLEETLRQYDSRALSGVGRYN